MALIGNRGMLPSERGSFNSTFSCQPTAVWPGHPIYQMSGLPPYFFNPITMKRKQLVLFLVCSLLGMTAWGQNLITNASFEADSSSFAPWQSGSWGGAQGVANVTTTQASEGASSLKLTVTTATPENVYKRFARQFWIDLDTLAAYTLSFDIMSMSGKAEAIGVNVASDKNIGSASWGAVWKQDSLAYQGDSTWHTMTYEIVAAAQNGTPDMDSLILFFGFGRDTGTFYLDNIRFEPKEVPPTPPAGTNFIVNGSFEDSASFEPWQIGNWGGAQGNAMVVTSTASDSNSSLEVTVTAATPENVYKRFVRQFWIELDSLATYTLSFDIMSMSGKDEAIGINVASDKNLGSASWGSVWKRDSLAYLGDGNWHTMTYDIVAAAQNGSPDMDSLILFMGFGRDTGTFYLDNVMFGPKGIAPPPPPPPADSNLIQNGSFEDSSLLATWQTGSWGGAQGVATVVTTTSTDSASSVEVTVTTAAPDNVYKRFLRQRWFEFDTLETYTLSFDVMSMSGKGEAIGVNVASDKGLGSATWGIIWKQDSLPYEGDGNWHTMTYDMVAQAKEGNPDMDSLILFFGFGRDTGTFYIDNVVLSLKKVVIPPPVDTGLVQNGNFETGIGDWQIGTWGGAMASFAQSTTASSAGNASAEVMVSAVPSDGNPFKAYVRKYPLELDSLRMYILSFDVMSNSGNAESIGVNLYSDLNLGSSAWGQVWKIDSIPYQGDGNWHTQSYNFFAVAEAGAPDMDALGLMFGFAKNAGTFYLDNVVLLATDSIKQNVATSHDVMANTFGLNLYPNPAEGNVFLAMNLPQAARITWRLTTLSGQEVLANDVQVSSGTQTLELPTQQLQKGMYLLSGRINEERFIRKIILK